jgi:hypothetical protein
MGSGRLLFRRAPLTLPLKRSLIGHLQRPVPQSGTGQPLPAIGICGVARAIEGILKTPPQKLKRGGN